MANEQANNPEHRDGFVIDGGDRLSEAARALIKKEVEAEFSERIAKANWLGRFTLRRQMRKEIERRIAKRMPSDDTLW